MKIPINEIFLSVDGEVNKWGQGHPTVFIRTQGCNLRCPYCDTKKTWPAAGGKELDVEDIVDIVLKSGFPKVTITGGEPLIHQGISALCKRLEYFDIKVSVETNGTIPFPTDCPDWNKWYKNVCIVIDYKIGVPGAGYPKQSARKFVKLLPAGGMGVIKILIGSWEDFLIAVDFITQFPDAFGEHSFLYDGYSFALSPIFENIGAEQIIVWLIEKGKEFPYLLQNTVINTQLHKFIFPNGEKIHLFC